MAPRPGPAAMRALPLAAVLLLALPALATPASAECVAETVPGSPVATSGSTCVTTREEGATRAARVDSTGDAMCIRQDEHREVALTADASTPYVLARTAGWGRDSAAPGCLTGASNLHDDDVFVGADTSNAYLCVYSFVAIPPSQTRIQCDEPIPLAPPSPPPIPPPLPPRPRCLVVLDGQCIPN